MCSQFVKNSKKGIDLRLYIWYKYIVFVRAHRYTAPFYCPTYEQIVNKRNGLLKGLILCEILRGEKS